MRIRRDVSVVVAVVVAVVLMTGCELCNPVAATSTEVHELESILKSTGTVRLLRREADESAEDVDELVLHVQSELDAVAKQIQSQLADLREAEARVEQRLVDVETALVKLVAREQQRTAYAWLWWAAPFVLLLCGVTGLTAVGMRKLETLERKAL